MNSFSEKKTYHTEMEFQRDVYNLLRRFHLPDELILIEPKINKGKTFISLDFELPNGLKIFGNDKPLIIELKLRITYNSFNQVLQQIFIYQELKPGFDILVLYDQYNSVQFSDLPNIAGVYFSSFQDFKFNLESQKGNFEVLKRDYLKTHSLEVEEKQEEVEASTEEDWRIESEQNYKNLKKKLETDNISLILGAGISMDSGVVDWNNLLISLLQRVENISDRQEAENQYRGLMNKVGHSTLIAARIICSRIVPDNLGKLIKEIFYGPIDEKMKGNIPFDYESTTLYHLARLIKEKDIKNVVTYNFDTLLEENLERLKKNCIPIYDKVNLGRNIVPVYHVHGILPHEDNHINVGTLILSEKDYHELYGNPSNWSNVVTLFVLHQTVCILTGLSMRDPNLRRLLDVAKDGSSLRKHYLFLGRPKHEDPEAQKREDYYCLKHKTTLNELGLNLIWYEIKPGNDHSELKKLLKGLYS